VTKHVVETLLEPELTQNSLLTVESLT